MIVPILIAAALPLARGQPIPEFVHGHECLFCHRVLTIKQKEEASPTAVTHVLGSRDKVRLLRKEGYGKFAIEENGTWDKNTFNEKCSGCHATGIDAATKTFLYFGLDCYTCHWAVDLNHGSDTSLVWLSNKKRSGTLAITSLCAQCHLREGSQSRSTKLPFPDNFVDGDNLFQDLRVEWNKADDPKLNAGDRHVYRNVRDVARDGSETHQPKLLRLSQRRGS